VQFPFFIALEKEEEKLNTQLSAYFKYFTLRDLAVIFPGIMLLHIPFFGVCKIHLDEVCS